MAVLLATGVGAPFCRRGEGRDPGQLRWPRAALRGTTLIPSTRSRAMTQMKHLSIVDGAFLHMESAEMPMHVARRMHLAPVFTRKLALMPFDLANPVWIHDDDIDLDYHVRYMVLPKPGTIEQLEALAARLHSMLLDRSRPLWEFYIIEGLADGRIGFYGKVHHAAVDGQALDHIE